MLKQAREFYRKLDRQRAVRFVFLTALVKIIIVLTNTVGVGLALTVLVRVLTRVLLTNSY